MIWHPDRHTGEDARAHATAKFAKLTHIHEILSNPTKRKLYDLYGEKGLTSGLEIASHLRSYEELKEEYQRQTRLRSERLLHARLGLAGILQATVSAEQLLRPWLHADSRHIVHVRGLSTGKKQERPPVSLESAMLSERVEVPLAPKYTASLQAYIVAQRGGRGAAVLSLGARREFSSRAWAKATIQACPHPRAVRALRHAPCRACPHRLGVTHHGLRQATPSAPCRVTL